MLHTSWSNPVPEAENPQYYKICQMPQDVCLNQYHLYPSTLWIYKYRPKNKQKSSVHALVLFVVSQLYLRKLLCLLDIFRTTPDASTP